MPGMAANQHYGKYGLLTTKGAVFAAKTEVAAIPILGTLVNAPTLWNTETSRCRVMPIRLQISPGAIGTPVLHGLTLSYVLATGDAIGAGLPIITFTDIVPVCTDVGNNRRAAVTRFAAGTVTFTANPTYFMDLGTGLWLEGTAATGVESVWAYDFDGTVVLEPGTAIVLGSTVATSTTYSVTILFAEI